MAVYISYIFSYDGMSQCLSSYILHDLPPIWRRWAFYPLPLGASHWIPHLSFVQPAMIMLLPLDPHLRHDIRSSIGIAAERSDDNELALGRCPSTRGCCGFISWATE